jgi:hypothetical protein
MSPRSLLRRRASRAYIVAPALLFLLTAGCSSGADSRPPEAELALAFPKQAPAVLRGGAGFARGGARFVPQAQPPSGFARRVEVELPEDGAGEVLFHGPRGFEARVRELGAEGPGRLVDRAVTYPREGGTSYWTTAPGGVEEWLQLGPGRATSDRPAAVWQVSGAEVHQVGAAVELGGADGKGRMRVTAPAAFAASGRRVPVWLVAGAGSSVELYVDAGGEAALVDPLWQAAGDMTGPLYGHKDATLGNGGVLVAGGFDGSPTVTPAAMVYDPAADAWSDAASMNTPRGCHTATGLGDGTALVAGGLDAADGYIRDVEIYDPGAGAWVYVPSMINTRLNHAATRLADGTVFVTGGKSDSAGGGVATAGFHGPNQFLLGLGQSCSNVGGGNSGSGGGGSTTGATEMFDPALQASGWFSTANMFNNRERHTATLLADGRVLAVGGESNGFVLQSAEVYDPGLDAWAYVNQSSMSSPREDHTATLLNDGTVLVTGGIWYPDGSQVLDTADLFVPNLGGGTGSGSGGPGSFVQTGSMSTPRMLHSASLLPDGKVLVAGGTDGFSSLDSAEVYDPATASWTVVPSMITARSQHTATALANGYILVSGGVDDLGDAGSTSEIYLWVLPLGSPCEDDGECASGHCADGVCCDATCDDTGCVACTASLKGGGSDGTCGPVAAGSNPKEYCGDDGVSSCGETGACDGLGDCALYAAGLACNPPYCQGNFVHGADLCDGSGSCLPSGNTLCDPALCNGGVCDPSCVVDTDCAQGAYCNAGTCAPQKPLGQPAGGPGECQSGLEADGVCCDAACTGTCAACTAQRKGGGADGTCGAVKAGTDPDGECPNQGAASCGGNGACDGAGACDLYAAGTVCLAGSCVGSTLVQPSLCDGAGTCVPGSAVSCAPAGCGGGACLSGCATDPDCAGTSYCNAGACAPQKPLGTGATGPNQCLSGFVADGVCCNVACTGTCVACTGLLKGGGADGLCGPSKAGTDPDNECPNQGSSSCGTNGVCDGAGACALYASGTVCAGASCQGNKLVQPSLCNGSGSCLSQGTVTCNPGVCAGGTCQSGCAVDADCVASAFCNAGMCAPKKPTGQPATGSNQCLSGSAADGVCCDVACVGTCVACSAAKKGSGADGTCGPVQAGADPDHECTDQGAASCGALGTCDGASGCTQYPAGTVCAPAACQGVTLLQASLCDGSGTCVPGAPISCAPAACVGGGCASSCVQDSDCVGTAYCNAAQCTPKKPLGQPATGPNECLGGFVADGICCNSACTGACAACTTAKKGGGVDGTCGAIQAGGDPDDECADQGATSCGTNGVCDGQGACALYAAGSVCAPGSCMGTNVIQPNLCDGSGACVVSGMKDCSPDPCVAGTCQSTCVTDADCAMATAYCGGGTCQSKKPAGEAAAGANECFSGFVADGVCCTSACQNGACDACSVAAGGLKDGDCSPLNGAACDDGDACTQLDTCMGTVCTGASPKDCPAMDVCHENGACDPTTGACTPVPKTDGAGCDDGNACTTDSCQAGVCKGVSSLDGTLCPGGVCIAGMCVLDPTLMTTSSSSSGASSSTGATTGGTGGSTTAGSGGAGGQGGVDNGTAPRLSGAGCASITPEPAGGGGPAALLLSLLGLLRRRRGPRARRQA